MGPADDSLVRVVRARRRRRALANAAIVAGVVVVVLVVAYLAAENGLGGGEGRTGFATGVRGTVWREPVTPAGSAGSPVAALVTVRDETGTKLGSVTSDGDGRFAVELPPGRYVLTAISPIDTALPVSQPVTVVVRRGQVATTHLVLVASSGPPLAVSPEPVP